MVGKETIDVLDDVRQRGALVVNRNNRRDAVSTSHASGCRAVIWLVSAARLSNCFTTAAGLPATMAKAGTSLLTTPRGRFTGYWPTWRPGAMLASRPSRTPSLPTFATPRPAGWV